MFRFWKYRGRPSLSILLFNENKLTLDSPTVDYHRVAIT